MTLPIADERLAELIEAYAPHEDGSTKMVKRKEWLGWHFLRPDGRIVRHNDNTEHGGTLVVPGMTLFAAGEIVPCVNGLHASAKPLDALQYAAGPIVQRVRLSGVIVEQDDKAAASVRETLWVMDASLALHVCAVNYAQIVLDAQSAKGHTIDPRSQAALDVKMAWLNGRASDSELDAAWAAARAAAMAAARGAAWDAARGAAWDAARAAARAAARDAAWAAAMDAARDAARDAAWDAARAAARDAARGAARDAARAAARDAAWDAARAAARDAARGAAMGAAWDAARAIQNAMLEVALLTQYETGHCRTC